MHIAIFGANSQIAQDLIRSFLLDRTFKLSLFLRDKKKFDTSMLTPAVHRNVKMFDYTDFNTTTKFDAIINFVGVGDPAMASKMGATIFDITLEYDKLALDYLKLNRKCRYIFLSSGAAYGGSFETPAHAKSLAMFDINNLKTTDWYAIAKFYAETRHRAYQDHSIIDIRVFNYFSHTQNLNARYFITDAVRALMENNELATSSTNIFRDYITPADFYNLIVKTLTARDSVNLALDCYTKGSTDKLSILNHLRSRFGLRFVINDASQQINATGAKLHYYSENKTASKLGYTPNFNSIEGLTHEIEKLQLFR